MRFRLNSNSEAAYEALPMPRNMRRMLRASCVRSVMMPATVSADKKRRMSVSSLTVHGRTAIRSSVQRASMASSRIGLSEAHKLAVEEVSRLFVANVLGKQCRPDARVKPSKLQEHAGIEGGEDIFIHTEPRVADGLHYLFSAGVL